MLSRAGASRADLRTFQNPAQSKTPPQCPARAKVLPTKKLSLPGGALKLVHVPGQNLRCLDALLVRHVDTVGHLDRRLDREDRVIDRGLLVRSRMPTGFHRVPAFAELVTGHDLDLTWLLAGTLKRADHAQPHAVVKGIDAVDLVAELSQESFHHGLRFLAVPFRGLAGQNGDAGGVIRHLVKE